MCYYNSCGGGKMILGAKALAEKLGVSRETLYRYMKKGMPYHQLSQKKRVFDLNEVENWLKGVK